MGRGCTNAPVGGVCDGSEVRWLHWLSQAIQHPVAVDPEGHAVRRCSEISLHPIGRTRFHGHQAQVSHRTPDVKIGT